MWCCVEVYGFSERERLNEIIIQSSSLLLHTAGELKETASGLALPSHAQGGLFTGVLTLRGHHQNAICIVLRGLATSSKVYTDTG